MKINEYIAMLRSGGQMSWAGWKKELTAEKGILTFKIFAKSLMSQSGFVDVVQLRENPDF